MPSIKLIFFSLFYPVTSPDSTVVQEEALMPSGDLLCGSSITCAARFKSDLLIISNQIRIFSTQHA